MNPSTVQIVAAVLFGAALVHTFSTKYFERLAHARPAHAGVWHLLGEVEVVFGFWALVLVLAIAAIDGMPAATTYLDSRRFTEPLFVFAIMVVAGSKPILDLASWLVNTAARAVPASHGVAFYFIALSIVPLLGSFITEPAAMTLGALLLRDRVFVASVPATLKYVTLGVLFVNVSIGGTLTPFAAPPVLMVANTWGWDLSTMMTMFGWRAAAAVAVNALGATLFARGTLAASSAERAAAPARAPAPITAVHVAFLAGIVVFVHHPPVFVGLLLFFLGFANAYERYQERLLLREGLMVAFFLAGLVVLGGQQAWWLQPLISDASDPALYFGATALTAVTDNAALTYLGSLVEGLSDTAKYALVAGAVTGGGLTVIANAPNPAGFSILKSRFADGTIHPGGLLLAALPPTLVAIGAFWVLRP